MVTSDLSKLTAQIEIERALVAAGVAVDNGLSLDGAADTQTISANTDEMITVYGVMDGEPRRILKIDARRILGKRLRDGRYAFWIPEMGGAAPARVAGTVRCYLDPAFDETMEPSGFNRAWLDSIGLAGRACNMMAPDKGIPRFTSAYERDEHARSKHRREYATIQAAVQQQRQKKLDDEARETREAMLAMANSATRRGRTAE